MSEFKIEIGKSYRTRNGKANVTIVGLDDIKSLLHRESHPYLGDDGEVYMTDGRYNENIECDYDLVSEIT